MADSDDTRFPVDVLFQGFQTALNELRNGINNCETELHETFKRALPEQGAQCEKISEKSSYSHQRPKTNSLLSKNKSYVTPDLSDLKPKRIRVSGPFWRDRFGPERRDRYLEHLESYRSACSKFARQLKHLEEHYDQVGGGVSVKRASESLRTNVEIICGPVKALVDCMTPNSSPETISLAEKVHDAHEELTMHIATFLKSLYEQRHAFHFSKVREWLDYNKNVYDQLYSLDESSQLGGLTRVINEEFFVNSQFSMTEVTDELRNFGERALPMFLTDEKERATTRYVNITTIATFFSSVTATTLQMTISAPIQSSLWDIVNFFWFMSLVFSVSSGVSSLLGMTWSKSSIYDTTSPPWLIKMWLDKAPIVFLIISALMFIVGLNLFAYLSSQTSFVSLSTNAFTVAHSICLFIVAVWFIYQLKRETTLVKWSNATLSSWWKAVTDAPSRLMNVLLSPLDKSNHGRHYQRSICLLLGLDGRVLQLNCVIYDRDWRREWPSPNRVIVYIRSAACFPKTATKSLLRRVKRGAAGDTEAGVGEEKTAENALEEYRQILQNIFGSSERIDEIIEKVRWWINGDYDWPKRELCKRLWGYQHLVDILFSAYADVRRRNIEKLQIKKNGREATPAVSEKEARPPPFSEPSTEIWAHAKVEDVSAEYVSQGPGWYALFNPGLERVLNVTPVHSLVYSSPVLCVRFSQDGKYLAIGFADGTAQIHAVTEGAKQCDLCVEQSSQSRIYSVCFSPNSDYLATAGQDGQIRIWCIKNKRTHKSLEGHQSRTNSLNYSKDGQFIVSGSDDCTARVWDLNTNSYKVLEAKTTEGEDTAVLSVSVSRDGRLVAAGCRDGIIRIWDVQTGYLVERLRGHRNWVRSVAFTPDDRGLISGSYDRRIKRWDLTPFLECDTRMEPLPPATAFTPMTTSAPGQSAAVPSKAGGERGSVCTMTSDGHKDVVNSVVVSQDGHWLVSGSDDQSVLFWDARNVQALSALHGHEDSVWSVDVSPTGDMLATGSLDGTTKIWKYKCIEADADVQ